MKDTNRPPVLLTLFKLFCSRLSFAVSEEVVLRPYYRVRMLRCGEP